MLLKIVFLRPQTWSRLKPYYKSTITAPSRLKPRIAHYGCTVFFCKAVGGGIYYFLRKKFDHTVRKKFDQKEVQNASSKKVRWAKLLCQSSTGRVPINFGGKKFKKLVREKFKRPNCSARAAQQSSKKGRWKKSSKCWFQKSSGGQTAPPEQHNKVRKKLGGKQGSKCWFQKSSVGQQAWETGFEKSSTAKRLYKPHSKNIQAEEATSKKVQPQRSRDPGGTSEVSSAFFFEIHHRQRSFGANFFWTHFKRFLRVWSSTICFALAYRVVGPQLTIKTISKSMVLHYLLCLSLTCRRVTIDIVFLCLVFALWSLCQPETIFSCICNFLGVVVFFKFPSSGSVQAMMKTFTRMMDNPWCHELTHGEEGIFTLGEFRTLGPIPYLLWMNSVWSWWIPYRLGEFFMLPVNSVPRGFSVLSGWILT